MRLYISLFLDAMALLRPLLLDVVPAIQQTAALALGRLANYNEDLAEAVVKGDILPQLVYSLAEQNVMFQSLFRLYTRSIFYYTTSSFEKGIKLRSSHKVYSVYLSVKNYYGYLDLFKEIKMLLSLQI